MSNLSSVSSPIALGSGFALSAAADFFFRRLRGPMGRTSLRFVGGDLLFSRLATRSVARFAGLPKVSGVRTYLSNRGQRVPCPACAGSDWWTGGPGYFGVDEVGRHVIGTLAGPLGIGQQPGSHRRRTPGV